VLVLLPFAALAAGASAEIVALVYGREFRAAGPILTLLTFAGMATLLASVLAVVLIAAERLAWVVWITVGLLPCAMLGHALLIPHLGMAGAALCSTASALVTAFLSTAALYRLWGLLPSAGTLLRSIALSGPAFALGACWPAQGSWLLVKLAAGSAVLVASFWLLGELNAEERSALWSIARGTGEPERLPRTA
jgi:O-antigen/teichoic acid export membrane protein